SGAAGGGLLHRFLIAARSAGRYSRVHLTDQIHTGDHECAPHLSPSAAPCCSCWPAPPPPRRTCACASAPTASGRPRSCPSASSISRPASTRKPSPPPSTPSSSTP